MAKKIFVAILFFLLGIGRNLPYNNLFFFGLGIADFLLVSFFFLYFLLNKPHFQLLVNNNKGIVNLMLVFLAWNLGSVIINMPFFGINLLDILESLRILYMIIIILATFFFTIKYKTLPGISFVFGIVFSGFIAYLNPMNPDVLGTVQIFNPNVIGNILSFSCIFLVLLMYLGANKVINSCLFIICFSFAFFTYSKATWVMLIISLLAFVLFFKQQFSKFNLLKKILAIIILMILIQSITSSKKYNEFMSVGKIILTSKIENSGFGSSASEGSSVGARLGLSYSGFYMFLQSPIWGVGVGNFQKVNDQNKIELGKYYYQDDNANSLIFHLLGTIGFVGLFIFFRILYSFYKQTLNLCKVYDVPKFYNYLLLSTILISINFQRELLTAYYFWILFGTTLGFVYIKTNLTPNTNE